MLVEKKVPLMRYKAANVCHFHEILVPGPQSSLGKFPTL